MNIQKIFMKRLTDEQADGAMVTVVRYAMSEKLEEKRDEGRGGWYTDNCSTEDLRIMLKEHAEKGDMVDVLNIAGMVLCREKLNLDGDLVLIASKGDDKMCKHDEGTTPHYDHVICNKCGMVRTDSDWGIASNKWFNSVEEATFYQRTGKRPE